jgi:hypothetical protein
MNETLGRNMTALNKCNSAMTDLNKKLVRIQRYCCPLQSNTIVLHPSLACPGA